jgi:predicted nuclease with TOPRIM domain
MAFTVSDFHDLIHILKTKPEWKEALRHELLGDEILRISEEFHAMQNAFRLLIEEFHGFRTDTEERLKKLDFAVSQVQVDISQVKGDVSQLKGDVSQLKGDVSQLKGDVSQLKGDVSQLKGDVSQLKGDVSQLKGDVSQVKGDVSQLKTNVADLQGERVERKYRDRPNVYFNQIIRKAKLLSDIEIANLLDDAEELGVITESEANYIRRSDAIITGRSKSTGEMLYLTVEASVVLDSHDAQRAVQRAKLLNKIPNVNAVGVIAGDKVDPKSADAIRNENVWCVTNGAVIEVIRPL